MGLSKLGLNSASTAGELSNQGQVYLSLSSAAEGEVFCWISSLLSPHSGHSRLFYIRGEQAGSQEKSTKLFSPWMLGNSPEKDVFTGVAFQYLTIKESYFSEVSMGISLFISWNSSEKETFYLVLK